MRRPNNFKNYFVFVSILKACLLIHQRFPSQYVFFTINYYNQFRLINKISLKVAYIFASICATQPACQGILKQRAVTLLQTVVGPDII